MADDVHYTYCIFDGDPAVTIPGVLGKVYINGAWKTIDSAELVTAAKVISKEQFESDFPEAAADWSDYDSNPPMPAA